MAELFADDFDQDTLGPSSIEFAVEDLFPGSEVEPALRDGDDDFAAHDLPFHVGVGVILAGAVVCVALGRGVKWGEFFEPLLVVLVQARFVVVDENRRGDVHGVDKDQAFLDAAGADDIFDFSGDILEGHAGGKLEGEMFGV